MIDQDRALFQQALDALLLVDLKNLVADYGTGHYAVSRQDAPELRAVIKALNERLKKSSP